MPACSEAVEDRLDDAVVRGKVAASGGGDLDPDAIGGRDQRAPGLDDVGLPGGGADDAIHHAPGDGGIFVEEIQRRGFLRDVDGGGGRWGGGRGRGSAAKSGREKSAATATSRKRNTGARICGRRLRVSIRRRKAAGRPQSSSRERSRERSMRPVTSRWWSYWYWRMAARVPGADVAVDAAAIVAVAAQGALHVDGEVIAAVIDPRAAVDRVAEVETDTPTDGLAVIGVVVAVRSNRA